jgi:predicted nucleic acid-binding protein
MRIATDAEQSDVLLLDTSSAIPILLVGHEAHATTMNAVRGHRLGLAGHAWFETYSVLTRLPAGLRRSPDDAFGLLDRNFPATVFLSDPASASVMRELAELSVSGGAVYDALVGAAARYHRLPLVSRDGRARSVYEALGVETLAIP